MEPDPMGFAPAARTLALSLLLAAPMLADSISVISNGTPRLREGAVAISPADARVVLAAAIAERAPRADVHLFRSADGGRTWSAAGLLPKQLPGQPVIGHWDPVLAFDRSGRAFITVVAALEETRWTIAVYRSDDGGLTWTGVDAGSPAAIRNDKPWIAIDEDDAIHLVWYQFGTGAVGMAYAISRDGGLSFSEPRLVAIGDGWPYVAVGSDDHVYFTYVARFSAVDLIISTDGGASFSAPSRIVSDTIYPHQIVVDRSHVYIFLPAHDGVYFARSTDRGATWSSLRRVSGAMGGMLPSIDVDTNTGEVVLAWYERESGVRARLFATRSRDGGVTLETPRAVSAPFDASRPIGEYNQLAIESGVQIVVFADEQGVFYAARLDPAGTT
ncbi:MAG TPA: sialidase family protein, partial [Thermoanaerobaculia bacterium]|nr:sialidase family protein [Thermoanaerobaculia bacterium]